MTDELSTLKAERHALAARMDQIDRRIAEITGTKRKRWMTDDVLQLAADIYRANLATTPTKAVARELGVRDRQAGNYVRRAREAGYLPPTTRGAKSA